MSRPKRPKPPKPPTPEMIRVFARIQRARELNLRQTTISIQPDYIIGTLEALERCGYSCVQSKWDPCLTEVAW